MILFGCPLCGGFFEVWVLATLAGSGGLAALASLINKVLKRKGKCKCSKS